MNHINDDQEQIPTEHPDPEGRKLATAVLVRAFKALNENDRGEIEESARFFANNRPDGMLAFWLRVQMGEDPMDSHRMAVCKRIGDKAVYHIGQTHHIVGTTKKPKKQREVNQLWTKTFHEVKDIPELAALAGA